MHEHVFMMSPEIMENYPDSWGDEDKREADAIDRLNELKTRGVDTIVDLTVIGLGRYIPRIARIAAATELNIVVATGLYTYNDVPLYFHYRGPGTLLDGPELMTDMFVRDINDGIADTGVKAAILKCATDEPGVTPGVERVLRAVAQAHRQTGVPISTHTHAATRRGLEQQRIFAEEGVDLSRVVIGHCGDTTDLGYLEELIGNGSYIGMDRFGLDTLPARSRSGSTPSRRCASAAMPTRWCCRTTPRAYFDWLPEELVPMCLAELALPAHPQRRAARAEGAWRHRRADHHDAGGQPAQDLRHPGRLLNGGTTPTDRHPGVAARRAGSRCARGHLLGPHAHPAPSSTCRPTGWRVPSPNAASASATT